MKRLSVNHKRNFAFQQRAGFLARMTQLLAGTGAGLIRFQQHAQRALRTTVVDQLQRNTLAANLHQVAGTDNHFGFCVRFGFRKEF